MEQTLLPATRALFSEELLEQLAAELQEAKADLRSALDSVVPLACHTLIGRVEGPYGAEALWKLSREAYGASILDSFATIRTAWQARSETLIQDLLGEAYHATALRVASTARLQLFSVDRLLGLATTAVLGVAGDYAHVHGLDAEGLARWLRQQQPVVRQALLLTPAQPVTAGASTYEPAPPLPIRPAGPPAVPPARPAGTWSTVGGGHAYTPSAALAAPAPVAGGASALRWQWGVLLLLAVGLGYFFGHNRLIPSADEPKAAAATAATTGRYDEASGNYIYDTGQPIILRLADGTTQKVGANSTENQLYTFLADPALQVDSVNRTKGWINFDRVYFETGQATLTEESYLQLRNVASILKTFPASIVKIGGYTDSTGAALKNYQLSEERAKTAMLALASMGIDLDRIQHKGYGGKYFITPNTTPEGRALNRRISIRVIRK